MRRCSNMEEVKEKVYVLPTKMLRELSSSSSKPVDAVIFVGISLLLGIACRHLFRGTRVPYTVALLIIGIGLGSIGSPLPFFNTSLLILTVVLAYRQNILNHQHRRSRTFN
ncbi:hypothetical protein V6N11_067753 [Hibiscus sabdariffa]|uniref:Uncharacterized protein n=1 Tax=Hibiscus sabdariffa TaxID=183260 RepID=A0ABR2SS26_9ROSI